MIDFSSLPQFRKDQKLMKRILFLIPQWQQAYPNVNIASELQWAHVWLLSNSRQHYRDMSRFLNNWMKNAQKRSGTHRIEFKPYREKLPPIEDQLTYEDIQAMKANR